MPKINCTGDFIIKAEKVHDGKFSYEKTFYVDNITEVIITCPKHGDFKQKPKNHMRYGCPKCANNQKKTLDDFVKEAKLIHKNKYDYSKSNYVNSYTDILIICPFHGKFYQRPKNHLSNGNGCPKCSSVNKKKSPGFKI